jgi:hypothetical protein
MTEPPGSSSKPETPSGSPEPPPYSVPYQGAPAGYPPPAPYPPQPGPYGYVGGGGYPPPPAPYSGYTLAPPVAPKNGMGVGALVTAIVSLPAAITVVGGFVLGLVAVVLGFIGYGRAKRGEANNGAVAIAGIVLGVLGMVLSAFVIAFGVWGFYKIGGGDYVDCMQRAGNDRSAQLQCEDEFKQNVEDRFSVTPTPTP